MPLQRVANRPILCHVLDALSEAGAVDIALVSPADVSEEIAECVQSEGPQAVAVRLIPQDGAREGGDAQLAAEFVGDAPCILHRADGLLGQSLVPFLETRLEESADALLLLQDAGADNRRLRLVPEQSPSVTGEVSTPRSGGIAGVCLLGPGALRRVSGHRGSPELLDFAGLADQLARNGGLTDVRIARKWRHFAGDALDLLDMNRTILDALDSETPAGGELDNHFEGHVDIDPTAHVTSSVIIGPVIIGPGAQVTESYIGPHTSIGERARIEGAELERSIVLADASVLFVSGRLVASIVGCRARVFRDFSMPRALRLHVGDGDEVALC